MPATVRTLLSRATGQAVVKASSAPTLRQDVPDEQDWLPQDLVEDLLAAYGIPLAPGALARTAVEAAAHAELLGYPVALKIVSPDIPHKSEIGGVHLDIHDSETLQTAFEGMLKRVAQEQPDARVAGVQVQRMIAGGQEVIAGVTQDTQFGPLLMFGSGGVEVEGLHDVAFAMAPPARLDLDYLLSETWAGRRLAGFRHLPPGDETAVRDVLLRLGQLAADFPQLAEIELNPLRVLPHGAFAVDVRARLKPAPRHPQGPA
jgi:acetyltransferase